MYNLRKRGGDSADKYFKATELVAGVKDMRFQALMPDILHWFGIKKIDNMVSMSDMCVLHCHVHTACLLTEFCQEIQRDCSVRYSDPEAI